MFFFHCYDKYNNKYNNKFLIHILYKLLIYRCEIFNDTVLKQGTNRKTKNKKYNSKHRSAKQKQVSYIINIIYLKRKTNFF